MKLCKMIGLVIGAIVVLIVIIVIGIVVYYRNGYTPYPRPTAPDAESMTNLYTPNAPWGWPKTNSEGKILTDAYGNEIWGTRSYISGDPPEGKCGIYTAQPQSQFTPGFPTIGQVAAGAVSLTRIDAAGGSCIDDDQIYARKAKHMCRGDLNLEVRTSGECKGVDGNIYAKGEIEEYWTSCDPATSSGTKDNPGGKSSHCEGSAALVAFHLQNVIGSGVFTGAYCLGSPVNYALDGEDGTILLEALTCDMRLLDQYDMSRTLFHVQRATYSRTGFTTSYSGNFVKIIHRRTGLCVAPQCQVSGGIFNLLEPIAGQLTLIEPNQTVTINGGQINLNGYWWFLLPETFDPACNDTTCYKTNQSITFLPDPTIPGKLTSPTEIWALIGQNPFVISAYNHPVMRADPISPYEIHNSGSTEGIKASYATAQYYDYSVIPILMNATQADLAFTFNT